MVLLFSTSCIQSTIQVIFFNITADGGDGADDDGRITADAAETTPTTRTTNTPTEGSVPSAMPIRTLAKTEGCFTCDVCKRSTRNGYVKTV